MYFVNKTSIPAVCSEIRSIAYMRILFTVNVMLSCEIEVLTSCDHLVAILAYQCSHEKIKTYYR